MPAIKYRVSLTEKEKEELESMLHKGKSGARKQTRARILLKASSGCKDAEITKALDISATMVYNTRQKCVECGVEAALVDRPRPGQAPKLNDKQCAQVIALACTPAPAGHKHWTLRLLADRVVQLGYAESFSHESVRQLLKKHPETLAGSGVVYSQGGIRLRRGDGRRTGFVRRTV
jgi:transposase